MRLGLSLAGVLVGVALTLHIAARSEEPPRLRFVNIASRSGLTAVNVSGGEKRKKYIVEMNGSGLAFLDYNRDGNVDVFFVNGRRLEDTGDPPTGHLYRNNGDGTFTDVTREAGLTYSGWGQGACVADFDNDGYDDLFVTYYGKNRLYRNNGDGSFTDVAERAGVAGEAGIWHSGCVFTDYDRDGRLDLFVASYVDMGVNFSKLPAPGSGQYCMYKSIPIACGPRGLPTAANSLFHNEGAGKFSDASSTSGIRATEGHYSLGAVAFDYDRDGWPDIYVACDSAPSILYHNNHDGTFHDRGVASATAYNDDGEPQAGMGVAATDYDHDGYFDLVKTNFSDDSPNLYHNSGDGTFADQIFQAGLGRHRNYMGWGVVAADFNNTGWPDILIVNGHLAPEVDTAQSESPYRQPKLLYRNRQNGRFEDVSHEAGTDLQTLHASRGAAVADIRNNGRLAVFVNEMGEAPSLLWPEGEAKGHWIGIGTVGTKSNRNGIGARVEVKTGAVTQADEVRSGGSYLSQSDLRLHFGLGPYRKVDQLTLLWPSGRIDTLKDVPADRHIVVEEGSSTWRDADDKKVR